MKKNIFASILLFFTTFAINHVNGQEKTVKLIQFSGVVVDADSLQPLPFTSIYIRHSQHGTIADYSGYFSLVAGKGDTIVFSEVGYVRSYFIIPDTLTTSRYSLIQILRKDTIHLKEAIIYPWPTRDQFKQMFLSLNTTDDDLERARKNLSAEALQEDYSSMPPDASLNYKYQLQQRYSKLYYAGQYPSITLLNPIAWAKFIEAWKRGDFKKKK